MKHIVCFSGGHSSALVGIEVVRKYGAENVIFLNHDIAPHVEAEDIKRFKIEVADYCGVPITYANHKNFPHVDQFDVTVKAKAFKVQNGQELCTSRLKTEPFMKWLTENVEPDKATIYYGFDKGETTRIQRRAGIMAAHGYRTDYPLALWAKRSIQSTHEVGIKPPLTYGLFKHANCIGCLKAGKQHWYLTYIHRPDIWQKARYAEDVIGYSIIKDVYLEELEDMFEKMKQAGIETTEHEDGRTFFARAKAVLSQTEQLVFAFDSSNKPCECVI